VVKVAKEYGMAEVWMNERLQRNCPKYVAQFVSAFEVSENRRKQAQRRSGRARSDPGAEDPRKKTLRLVWKFEGKDTLDSAIMRKDFPYCMEELLFDRSLEGVESDPAWRKARSIRMIMQQILEGLKSMHAVGIVHRDVKPQNIILAEGDRRLKFIDFGAAADLLIGINYTPDDYLLDPRYSAPERYIMSTSTPRPPTAPFAALLSPVLWLLNQPDRFDMYSVGLIFMQLVFEPLRRDAGLNTFSKALQKGNYSVQAWRKTVERDAKFSEGCAIMALDNGAGWDLAEKLLNVEPGARLTAGAALAHPFTYRIPVLSGLSMAFNSLIGGTALLPKSVRTGTQYIGDKIVKSGTQSGGGLTELDLRQIYRETQGKGGDDFLAEDSLEDVSETVSQWKRRKSILQTRKDLGTQLIRAGGGGREKAKQEPPLPRVPPAPWWKRQSSTSGSSP
jgi:serine/threonine protein kinase